MKPKKTFKKTKELAYALKEEAYWKEQMEQQEAEATKAMKKYSKWEEWAKKYTAWEARLEKWELACEGLWQL